MEALRYVPFLNKDGWVITSSEPLVNIPNYPDAQRVADALRRLPHVKALPINSMAREHHMPKSANMLLLGMAADTIGILSPEQLRAAIGRIFAAKGARVVEDNYKAFDLGLKEER